MNDRDPFSETVYLDQMQSAERELTAFVSAVSKLFGPTQAGMAAEDWLQEAELMGEAPRSTTRDWRLVTIAASAHLANRIDAQEYRRKSRAA